MAFQKRLVRFFPPYQGGDRGGCMQTKKNLPQPLLVKEGRKKNHYLSGLV